MLPLEDHSWDMQFQCDNGNYQEINIGWFWARPTPVVREFFWRSQERWIETQRWDQEIMNEVRWEMMEEGLLADPKTRILDLADYRSTMLFDWWSVYANTTLIDKMNRKTVMVHYTMVFGLDKIILAKHFGHWFNETYYTQPIRLLQPINLVGTADKIREQIDFSVSLAKMTGRTFMWPVLVNKTVEEDLDISWESLPSILVADVNNVANIVPWVEGTYLHNRRKYAVAELSKTTISAIRNQSDINEVQEVTDNCLSSIYEVVELDFAGVAE
jgi:hypothetical protein